jgi:polyisoprenoid-binding protein YceI
VFVNCNSKDDNSEDPMRSRALAAAFAFTLLAGASSLAVGQPAMPTASTDPATAPAGHYELDPMHASVIARIKHFGLSNFAIRFDTVQGAFDFDPAKPTASKVTASVDANSFDVGTQKYQDMTLNEHFIKQRDILGNSKNPMVSFASTSIKTTAANKGTMAGDLTLNGVTKPVTFDVTFNGTMKGMGGGPQRMGFTALTTIKRSDFGVAPQMPATVLSDDVSLHIEAEFTKKAG